MIAEKEAVPTFLLQLLSERGILDRLAFKGPPSSLRSAKQLDPIKHSNTGHRALNYFGVAKIDIEI
jgi:hypothetical protein